MTSPEWAARDAAEPAIHEAEALDMGQWLRLADAERNAVVAQYAQRRPRLSRLPSRV